MTSAIDPIGDAADAAWRFVIERTLGVAKEQLRDAAADDRAGDDESRDARMQALRLWLLTECTPEVVADMLMVGLWDQMWAEAQHMALTIDRELAAILDDPQPNYTGQRRFRDGRCDCPPDVQSAGDGWRCRECGGSRVTPGGAP